ncbi:MAG: 50S ribosomal protein L10 [Myxococcota bacterium]|nr:50S ribosomal protein L10 [Myxococcota bacterium]MDW8361672.1 50S ribosomal protein L10 [Myxococcales bacterium]
MAAQNVRDAKNAQIAQIRDRFRRSASAVFVDPRHVDVETITNLRVRFREKGVEYRVAKNTLVRRALEGTPYERAGVDRLLVGMTGVAWSYEDPTAAARVLKAFRAENEKHGKLTIKGGVVESTLFGAEEVESTLATMPGRDEVRATLLATLQAPAQRLVGQLAAPMQSLVRVLDARRRQLEGA